MAGWLVMLLHVDIHSVSVKSQAKQQKGINFGNLLSVREGYPCAQLIFNVELSRSCFVLPRTTNPPNGLCSIFVQVSWLGIGDFTFISLIASENLICCLKERGESFVFTSLNNKLSFSGLRILLNSIRFHH